MKLFLIFQLGTPSKQVFWSDSAVFSHYLSRNSNHYAVKLQIVEALKVDVSWQPPPTRTPELNEVNESNREITTIIILIFFLDTY
jgi:hypothetical protein